VPRLPSAVFVTWVLWACACSGPEPQHGRDGTVRGALTVSAGTRGGAWLFLYPPGQGFPTTQAFPEQVTAVSDVRLKEGDTRFVFAQVPPNPYRLWGFLDTNLDFEPNIDVLGGPGAGDRVAQGLELNVEPGADLEVAFALSTHLRHEPPAFRIERDVQGDEVVLPSAPGNVLRFELRADALGILDERRSGFVVGLGDADGDGVADDDNGDGVPDLFPQVYLRFLRRPGQVVPLGPDGQPAEVIVPLVFDPGPYLALLANDPAQEVVADRLTAFVLPQAQAITWEKGRGRVVTPMDAIPVGEYELWVVSESGQFWRVPNDLGGLDARHLGGPFASQATRFRFVR
jgi:hypothetical protein